MNDMEKEGGVKKDNEQNIYDEIIPRYYYALQVQNNSKSKPNFHYLTKIPDKIEDCHVYLIRLGDYLYYINDCQMALGSDDPIEFMTSDPKGFQSELFIKLYGKDHFSTNLRSIHIVNINKESKLDVYTQFFTTWKDPAVILKMLFQINQHIYHVPYLTYEKQIKSKLPEMLDKIGKEICYGPIVLYQNGSLTKKQVEKLSGVKVIHEDELETCNDEFGIFHRNGHYIAFIQKDNVYTFHDSTGHHLIKEWTWLQGKKHKLISYGVQIDNRSCGMYSSFYIDQLKKYGDVKYTQFTFQDVHDWNTKLVADKLKGGSSINFTLIHNDEIENKAREWILSFYKKLPFSISDITLNSQEKWSTSYPTKIVLGLVWNQTPQDLMCLWIHEQLHRWEKTRDLKWLEYVKQNYPDRNMDPDMVRFAGDDIDSNFAQHLVVIWNAFNITKQFYPDYVKGDVAYVVFQKFIRDNWERIQKDLEQFDLVIKNKQSTIMYGGKKKLQKSIKGGNDDDGNKDNDRNDGNGGDGNGYVCKCAFSRNKGVKSYTCLVDNELNLLRKIINDKEITTPEQLYQKLINNYKCSSSKNGVDQCVRDNLVQQYGSNVENVFKNALPLKNQIDTLTQWLSSSNIDLLASQLEYNHPQFKYMGIQTWDMFEDQKEDVDNHLNPEFIIKTIKEHPTKTVFGWVLNLCHKFSSGTHWVAMGLVKQNEKQFKWMYYDSQDKDGPQTDTISCDFRDGLSITPQQQKKYSDYQSQFPQWWEQVQQTFSKNGFIINKVIDHNNFITQNDGYTCGYHAFYFLYLITTEKDKSINALSLQISATQSKVLDQFMKEFQKKVFELK